LLSFSNLIEAHVLRSLRTEHGVPVKALRSALSYAENALGIDRLLLRPELRADAGRILLERYGQLIDLSTSGQLAMRLLFDEHLKRVENVQLSSTHANSGQLRQTYKRRNLDRRRWISLA
jgi:hypothetical protein